MHAESLLRGDTAVRVNKRVVSSRDEAFVYCLRLVSEMKLGGQSPSVRAIGTSLRSSSGAHGLAFGMIALARGFLWKELR